MEESQALTSKGLPDLSLVVGQIVTQCWKKTGLFRLYIYFYIFLFIYISLQTHNEREPRSQTGKESSASFPFFFFSLFLYLFKLPCFAALPLLSIITKASDIVIAPELYEAEFNLQS